jgi:dTDP-4-amino-4,6-dideoxygalactose transaminase
MPSYPVDPRVLAERAAKAAEAECVAKAAAEAERAATEVLSLPVHPALTQADLETIVKTINLYIAQ